jgi:hypothetical protein
MEIFAATIFVCFILYLVDKNHKWKWFGIVVGALTVLAVLAVAALYLNDEYESHRYKQTRIALGQCAHKVFPGAYDDLSDYDLGEKIIEKVPSPSQDCGQLATQWKSARIQTPDQTTGK